jgi:hypothetical protein
MWQLQSVLLVVVTQLASLDPSLDVSSCERIGRVHRLGC